MSSRTHQTHAVTGIGQINLNVDAHATVDYASLPVSTAGNCSSNSAVIHPLVENVVANATGSANVTSTV